MFLHISWSIWYW